MRSFHSSEFLNSSKAWPLLSKIESWNNGYVIVSGKFDTSHHSLKSHEIQQDVDKINQNLVDELFGVYFPPYLLKNSQSKRSHQKMPL